MKISILRISIAAAATVFFCAAVAAESLSVYDLQAETGARFQWDPFRRHGLLWKGSRVVSFKTGSPFVVFDFSEQSAVAPVTLERGVPIFPRETADRVRTFFSKPVIQPDSPVISTIIIDPGHGGRDAGAVATHTIRGKSVTLEEKHIVLDVSLATAKLLEERFPEKRIVLTRTTDTYPSLEERVELANGIVLAENESIIYLSIHANASPFNKNAKGFEAWYLPPDYRRELITPDSVKDGGEDILPILNTMLEEEYTVESILLARNITRGIERTVGDASPNRGLKEQSWFVVRNAKMPSVLIEIGFVTNLDEAALLLEPAYLKKLSQGIYNGVVEYILSFENPERSAQ
jgi:N-acetylmuramoyl-L-alanine amidase